MKLQTWIKNKEQQLVNENGFRSASLDGLNNCQISQFMTSTIFDFTNTKIDTDIEITEVNRNTLGNQKIDAIEVTFDVVKPRCRKSSTYRLYVAKA